MDTNNSAQDAKSDIDTSGRRASISSLSSTGYDSSFYASERQAAANASLTAIPPNTTGNSLLSSRVSQSRHFGTLTPVSGLNGSLLNQLQSSASASASVVQTLSNLSPVDTTAATAASNSIHTTLTNNTQDTNSGMQPHQGGPIAESSTHPHDHQARGDDGGLVKQAIVKHAADESNDLDVTSSTIDSGSQLKHGQPQSRPQPFPSLFQAQSPFSTQPPQQQQQQQQATAQLQQQTLTGSTNNSFNPNWLPQQQSNSLLNVTPWIEQQAQLSPNLNFHQYSSLNDLSSHSTGNDPASNFNSSLNPNAQNLATNLSLLASSSMLSSLNSNPINQLSQQQQLRQPQYMKLPNNISPPNNNETVMNTGSTYPSNYGNCSNYQSYPNYPNSNSSNITLHKATTGPTATNSASNNLNNNTSNNNINNNTTTTINTNTATNQNSANNSNNNSSNKPNTADDDELIPTAIVIKNIPFAIKREQLLNVMSKLNLPLPYAFNYHFDNGVFRGLAFANFNSIEETAMVVSMMNGREIDGRKLRVEYKKMLPLQERERIEREKKEKRCQLEEQHRSNSVTSLASLYSTVSAPPATPLNQNNLPNLVPPPSSATNANTSNTSNNNVNNNSSQNISDSNNQIDKGLVVIPPVDQLPTPPSELDFNNSEVLEIYTRLILFREEFKYTSLAELKFSSASLSTNSRNYITQLCKFLNLSEFSEDGVVIVKRPEVLDQRVQAQQLTGGNMNSANASLNFQPSLIRSHSHNVINTNPSLSLNTNRYRQQSPRTISQNPQYAFNNQQSSMGLPMSNMNMNMAMGMNVGSLQQLQQQSQQQTHQLHHSSSTASLNLLRNKGLTAPTTPNTSRQATFPANTGLTSLFNSQQPHGLANQGFNHPQITGGSNISMSTNKGMDELYNGMEYLSFDNA